MADCKTDGSFHAQLICSSQTRWPSTDVFKREKKADDASKIEAKKVTKSYTFSMNPSVHHSLI